MNATATTAQNFATACRLAPHADDRTEILAMARIDEDEIRLGGSTADAWSEILAHANRIGAMSDLIKAFNRWSAA